MQNFLRLFSRIFLLLTVVYTTLTLSYAANPSAPFTPTDRILDPSCAPTDSNCYVSLGESFVPSNAVLIGVGDSRMAANIAASNAGDPSNPENYQIPYYLSQLPQFKNRTVISTALGGTNMDTHIANYATQVYPHRPSANNGRAAYIFLWDMYNDINADNLTASQWYSKWSTYVNQAKADGFKVVAFTDPKNYTASASKQIIQSDANKLLRNGLLYDYLIDLDQMEVLPSDTSFYVDGLHPTALGNQLIAKYINGVFGGVKFQLPSANNIGLAASYSQGDIIAARGSTQGVIFLGNTGNNYMYYNSGTLDMTGVSNFNVPGNISSNLSSTSGTLKLGSDGNVYVYRSSGNNVSATGNWSYNSKLTINGSDANEKLSVTGSGVMANFSNLTDQDFKISLTAPGALDKNALLSAAANTSLAFGIGASEKMRLISNGNFGIGTSSPSQLFTVGNNNQFTVSASGIASTTALGITGIGMTPTSNLFTVASSTGTTLFNVLANGNIGIGTTTPGAKFAVVGSGVFTGNLDSQNFSTDYGVDSSFIGIDAGNSTFSSSGGITGVGYRSLRNITSGAYNSGFGSYSLTSLTSGSDNVGIGHNAGYSITTGNNNAIVGISAMYFNQTGIGNVAMGYHAMEYAGDVDESVAIGWNALLGGGVSATPGKNTTGDHNTAVGAFSLVNTTSGAGNTAVGWYGQSGLSTGGYNSSLGWHSFNDLTTGSNNTALGSNAGWGNGSFTFSNTTGSNNTFIGSNTNLASNNQRDHLTVIGADATGDRSNAVYLGRNLDSVIVPGKLGISTSTPLYLLHVGNTTVSGVVSRFENSTGYCDINPTTTSLSCTSDARLKKNILEISSSTSLATLTQLRPVTYNWLSEDNASSTHAGFIAQEVLPLYPDLVTTDAQGTMSVSYSGFIPYIVQSIRELFAMVSSFKNSFTTDTLCVGTAGNKTCITKSQLDALLENSGQSSQQIILLENTTPSPNATSTATTTEELPEEEVEEPVEEGVVEEITEEEPVEESSPDTTPEVGQEVIQE